VPSPNEKKKKKRLSRFPEKKKGKRKRDRQPEKERIEMAKTNEGVKKRKKEKKKNSCEEKGGGEEMKLPNLGKKKELGGGSCPFLWRKRKGRGKGVQCRLKERGRLYNVDQKKRGKARALNDFEGEEKRGKAPVRP